MKNALCPKRLKPLVSAETGTCALSFSPRCRHLCFEAFEVFVAQEESLLREHQLFYRYLMCEVCVPVFGFGERGFHKAGGKTGTGSWFAEQNWRENTSRTSLRGFISTILKMKLSDLQREQNFFFVPLEFIHSLRIPFRGNTKKSRSKGRRMPGSTLQAYFGDVMQ